MSAIGLVLTLAALPSGLAKASFIPAEDILLLEQIASQTYPRVSISCFESHGEVVLGACIDDNWAGSAHQLEQMGYIMGAFGEFSSNATWFADSVMVTFRGRGFRCTGVAAEELGSETGAWTSNQVIGWFMKNLIEFEYWGSLPHQDPAPGRISKVICQNSSFPSVLVEKGGNDGS